MLKEREDDIDEFPGFKFESLLGISRNRKSLADDRELRRPSGDRRSDIGIIRGMRVLLRFDGPELEMHRVSRPPPRKSRSGQKSRQFLLIVGHYINC